MSFVAKNQCVDFSPGVIGDNQVLCEGGFPNLIEFDIEPSGGNESYNYQWYACVSGDCENPPTNYNIINGATDSYLQLPSFPEGIYYYAVLVETDDGLCSEWTNFVTVEFVQDPEIVIYATSYEVCEGEIVDVFADVDGGVGDCVFQWEYSDNGIDWNIVGEDSDQISFSTEETIEDRLFRAIYSCDGLGCNVAFSNTIQILVQEVPDWIEVTALPDLLCVGGEVNLSATIEGGFGGDLTWFVSPYGENSWIIVDSPHMPDVGQWSYMPDYQPIGVGCEIGEPPVVSVNVVQPEVTISTDNNQVCLNDELIINAESDFGVGNCVYEWQVYEDGEWITIGENNNSLNVNTTNPVTNQNYRVLFICDGQGCETVYSNEISITVFDLPHMICDDEFLCINDDPFVLNNGQPPGGIYSGIGVIDELFYPNLAGTGEHTTHYEFFDLDTECSNECSFAITVYEQPNVSCSNISVCIDSEALALSNSSPEGGTYSGTGVVSGYFYPSVAGVGVHNISYTYIDPVTDCSNTCTFNIVVNDLPELTCPNISVCSNDSEFLLNTVSPSGGVYSGDFVNDNQFNPELSGTGIFPVTYSLTDANGCENSCTFDITVNAIPSAPNCPAYDNLCINSGVQELSGATPEGGVYTGTAVFSGDFNPLVAGAGTHNIVYTITDVNNCENSCSFDITVDEAPTVTCSNLSVCIDSEPFVLVVGQPSGGVYSGDGVVAGAFHPIDAGIGTHNISYSYTDPSTGCSNICTFTITVNGLPALTCNDFSVCADAPEFLLTSATPSGGNYSGVFVSENNFNPSLSGVGNFIITYNYTDGHGCENSCTFNITVNELPPAPTCPSYDDICLNSDIIELSGANPIGGTYSGFGVSGNDFNPFNAGVGIHEISYTVEDAITGCLNQCSFDIEVLPIPIVTCPEDIFVEINADVFNLAGANPEGGNYMIDGLVVDDFNPATFGLGSHQVIYEYTDTNTGCTDLCNFTITVYQPDIASCPGDMSLCLNDPEFNLSGATPLGGTYFYQGTAITSFNPASYGVGNFQITYTYEEYEPCSFIITVLDLPSFNCPDISICIDSDPLSLNTAQPVGGSYFGNGVITGIFYPNVAGVGSHNITYTYTDPVTGCSGFCEFTITVNDLPELTCNGISVCADEPEFLLTTATPAGGNYSGVFVSSSNFNPTLSGTGVFEVTYTYTDSNGCENTCTFDVTVNELPPVPSCPSYDDVCIDSENIELTGGIPIGGVFSGTGVSVGEFNPSIAGVGTHNIIYTITDFFTGCENSCSFDITVNDNPFVSCSDISICIDVEPFSLDQGEPAGGEYSGVGVVDGIFYPNDAGAGTHNITYTYTDPVTECSEFCEFTITVNSLPELTCDDISVCADEPEFLLGIANPAGGNYSGDYVSENHFDPSLSGIGNFEITYHYIDSNGCENTCTFDVIVNDLPPTPTCPVYDDICIDSEIIVLDGVIPIGGDFTGTGVVAGEFTPSIAGVGTHNILYTITDFVTGCENSCSFDITVNDNPFVSCSDISICIDVEPFALDQGEPTGGEYSGVGVVDGIFYPNDAGAGTHNITYTYTDPVTDCSDFCEFTITVNSLPELTCEDISVCADEPEFLLNTATPAGGDYSGDYVSENHFSPSLSGVGEFEVMYHYIDSNGCENTCTFSFTVNELPSEPTCPIYDDICIDAEIIELTGVIPEGGEFLGAGVTDSEFNPIIAGVGTHNILYTITDFITGCENSCSFDITVNDTPFVSCSDISICIDVEPFALDQGEPAGGEYSGVGVVDGIFYPIDAGAGIHSITYTYTDPITECSDFCEFTITVNSLPELTCDDISVCADEPEFLLNTATPVGGDYSGDYVSENHFNPSLSGVGEFEVTYHYIDSNGCENSYTFNISVNEIPSEPTCPVYDDICIDAGIIELTGVIPEGGEFSGPGVIGTEFNPANANVGIHTIIYTIEDDITGCENNCEIVIEVFPLPDLSCPENIFVSIESEEFFLSGAEPEGGTYYIDGVPVSEFNPDDYGIGVFIVSYVFTDLITGCENNCTFTINVFDEVVAVCPSDIILCENDSEIILTGATPPGGEYFYDGTVISEFNPSTYGAGDYLITYIYEDLDPCEFNITVNEIPFISCSHISICIDIEPFALDQGEPAGGEYSGVGVVDGIFYPNDAGVGTHNITYTFTDPITGCSNFCEFTITVSDLPELTCNDIFVCADEPDFLLSIANPAGGDYSGDYVSENNFSPTLSGIGEFEVTYNYIDSNGCENFCTFSITVNELPPAPTCPVYDDVCIDSEIIELTGVIPEGGEFLGAGVTDSEFNPVTAGMGTHNILYTITDFVTGCENSCSFDITVNDTPIVSCSDISICVDIEPFALDHGEPVGGEYSGVGVIDGIFYPNDAGVGTHNITYTFTDPITACSNFCEFTITVSDLPELNCNDIFVCADEPDFLLSIANPAGGDYSGDYVSENNFSPTLSGIGEFEVTYNYIDSNGCENTCTFDVIVNELPPLPTCPVYDDVCIDSEIIELTGVIPDGGVFSGPGVIGTEFNPANANVGIHTIIYTIEDDITGCENNCEIIIEVFDLPELSCPENIFVSIESEEFPLSGANPEGGFYSIDGILVSDFNPTDYGIGVFNVTYEYTDIATDCNNTCLFTITVYDENVAVCPSDILLCESDSEIILTGATPPGGEYFYDGTAISEFNPSTYGAGDYLITYIYEDLDPCEFNITVNEIPFISCSDISICIDVEPFALDQSEPAGGEYSGVGVVDGIFYPNDAGVGTHNITYTFTDLVTGCSDFCEFTITVSDLPELTCNDISVCADETEFSLTTAIPSGGDYSGDYVSENHFNPSLSGIGEFEVTYHYIDSNGCENSCTFNISVNEIPSEPTCPIYDDICIDADIIELTGVIPEGGDFSGPGVIGTEFNPANANEGVNTIIYTIEDDITGCTNQCEVIIEVFALPEISCPEDIIISIESEEFLLSGAEPEGGTYYIDGIPISEFNPDDYGVGVYEVSYEFMDILTGCQNLCLFTITVFDPDDIICPIDMSFCIDDDVLTLSGAIPPGGDYYYSGTQISEFDPELYGQGDFIITYYYEGVEACDFIITVNDLPELLCSDINVCVNSEPIELSHSQPLGGVYFGEGIVDGIFYPIDAGVGTHNIIYTYTDPVTECSDFCEFTITVNSLAELTCDDIYVCANEPEFLLNSATPVGGDYLGDFVSDNHFNPSLSGVGEFEVTYHYIDSNNCENTCTFNVTVNDLPPAPTCPVFDDVCIDSEIIELTGVMPEGGEFSGPGVIDIEFNPSVANAGVHTIIYAIEDDITGCTNNCEIIIEVFDLPDLSCPENIFVSLDSDEFTLSGALPEGGIFYIDGIAVSDFNPADYEIGVYEVIYEYTDFATECNNFCSFTITVYDDTELVCPEDIHVCIYDSAFLLSGATPPGGIYYFEEVEVIEFDPNVFGVGNFIITYSYQEYEPCQFTISVNPQPNVEISILSQPNCGEDNGVAQAIVSGGSEPYDYYWNGSSEPTLEIIDNLQAGEVTVTVTDSFGCSNDYSKIITSISDISIDAYEENMVTCYQEANGIAGIDIAGGTPPYSVIILSEGEEVGSLTADSEGTILINDLDEGEYQVEIIDADLCLAIADFTITTVEQISLSLETISSVLCYNGSEGVIEISVSGGMPPFSISVLNEDYSYQFEADFDEFIIVDSLSAGNYELLITDSFNCIKDTLFSLIEPDEISFNISEINHPTCYNYSDASFLINAQGGTGNYQYMLENVGVPSNNPEISNLSAGWHTFVIIDENECYATDSVEIINPAALSITSPDTLFLACYGDSNGSVTATIGGGTPNYSIAWYDYQNNEISTNPWVHNLSAGNYIISVTDQNLCVKVDTVIVYEPGEIISQLGYQPPSCYSFTDGIVWTSVSGGSPPYNYQWNMSPLNLDSLFNIASDLWRVTITDAHMCSIIDSIEVSQPTPLEVLDHTTPVDCNAQMGTSQVAVSGGTDPYSYEWSTGDLTSVVYNLAGGEHTVTITDNNNCIIEHAVEVEVFGGISVSIVQLESILCHGDNTASLRADAIGHAPFSYDWSVSGNTQVISSLFAGEYSITVTDSRNCSGVDSHIVSQPDELVLSFESENIACRGDSSGKSKVIIQGGTSPYSVEWHHNGSNSVQISNLSAGMYSVDVTDNNNCVVSGSVNINEPAQTLNAVVSGNHVRCHGSKDGRIWVETFGGSPPYSYTWSGPANFYEESNHAINNVGAGDYYLTVTDDNNCNFYTQYSLIQPGPININIRYYQGPSCIGNYDGFIIVDSITGGTKPYWIRVSGDGFFWEQQQYLIDSLYGGTYRIDVIDANNCIQTGGSAIVNLIDDDVSCLRIPAAFSPNDDGYNDTWQIDNLHMFPRALIQVYNRWGQVIYEARSGAPFWDGTYNGKPVPTGAYIYHIDLNLGDVKPLHGIVTVIR